MNTHKTLFKFGLKKLGLLLAPLLIAGLVASVLGASAGCTAPGTCYD